MKIDQDLLQAAKHKYLSLDPPCPATWLYSRSTYELVTELDLEIQNRLDDHFLFIVPTETSKLELSEQLDIPSNQIESLYPEPSQVSRRLSYVIPNHTSLVVWDYQAMGPVYVDPIINKEWHQLFICAVYL